MSCHCSKMSLGYWVASSIEHVLDSRQPCESHCVAYDGHGSVELPEVDPSGRRARLLRYLPSNLKVTVRLAVRAAWSKKTLHKGSRSARTPYSTCSKNHSCHLLRQLEIGIFCIKNSGMMPAIDITTLYISGLFSYHLQGDAVFVYKLWTRHPNNL